METYIEKVVSELMGDEFSYLIKMEKVRIGSDVLNYSDYYGVFDFSFMEYARKDIGLGFRTECIIGVKDWSTIDEYIKYHGEDYEYYEGEKLTREVFVREFDSKAGNVLYDVRRMAEEALENVKDNIDEIKFSL